MSDPTDHTRPDTAEAQRAGVSGVADASSAPSRRGQSASNVPSTRPGGPESLVGVVLGGRYSVERVIGEGGMGAVYLAEHTLMRKRFALKVLHPEMGRLPEVVARFEREAMAAAHIEHPNVAAATDFGKLDDGSFFLVLEYVEGTSLRDAISEGRLELGRALHITRQIASALARAQALGIVHRDLKPENIMLVTREGDPNFVKVLDFGIAKVPVGELFGERQSSGGQALTQLGMVYGTPEYMAPEQALGQAIDARADLYALGVMAFEMITGARPYNHESKVTLLGMHVAAPIPHMTERAPDASVPEEVDAIVTRLLAKDATARFADARELIDALDMAAAQLTARGRIADSSTPMSLKQGPHLSSPRFVQSDPAVFSPLALGPTHVAARAGAAEIPWLVSLVAPLRRAVESAPPWAKSRRVAVIVTIALGALSWMVTMAVTRRGGSAAVGSPTEDGRPAAVTGVPDTKTDSIVTAAQATIDRGDFASAVDALAAVEKKDPTRADVHMLLERAYTGVRNARDAMREAALGLSADPREAADLKLQEDVRNAALLKETQEDAIALLESKMGARGVDILYDIAFGTSGRLYAQAAMRARRSLDLESVRARASPALAALLDFRDAKTCEDKHALLERARDQGDARFLSLLQPYESTRGCGFLGRSDCHPCMHKDRLLSEAMGAIEQRATRGGGQ
ncbi:MAG: serine/threonine protein kinase [Myxococcota bacterium]|nr:serine/threonine protein kinase [Myxococcota bacterium]